MRKRERLERAIAGEPVDRVPVALWRHFPGDDQRAADLARSAVDFQREFDWDFVRVMPANTFLTVDYGVQDAWLGDDRGLREITRHIIQRSLDWTELRPLSPDRGAMSQLRDCLSMICQATAADHVPIVLTIYSPLIQAAQLAGQTRLMRDLRLHVDRLCSGLGVLTESTLRLLDAIRHLPEIAGIFFVTRFASHNVMSAQEYHEHAMPYNLNILEALPRHWWLNIVQMHGDSPMLSLFRESSAQIINWDAVACEPDLESGKSLVPFAVGGGLNDRRHLHQGTPSLLTEAVRAAISQTDGRRFLLTGSGDGYITAPQSNLRAIRSAVENLAR